MPTLVLLSTVLAISPLYTKLTHRLTRKKFWPSEHDNGAVSNISIVAAESYLQYRYSTVSTCFETIFELLSTR